MSAESFAAIPWTAVVDDATGTTTGWYKHRVPYLPDATYLQTVDLWVPASLAPAPPAPDSVPARPDRPWVVYLHGGAWRDPLVDSSSYSATAKTLLRRAASASASASASSSAGPALFAGLASINYRLSPHPHHPTRPAPPADPAQPPDPARMARHPDHLADVLAALAYLQTGLGVARDYLLSGHSCGATLAFEVVMDRAGVGLDGADVPPVRKPAAILGLNGLYDLVQFLRAPDASHAKLASLYDAFTRNAFGDDEATWARVCPRPVADWAAVWPEGRRVVLVQSREDTLVPYSQTAAMRASLEASRGGPPVDEMAAGGDHNGLWQAGDRLAEIVEAVLAEWPY